MSDVSNDPGNGDEGHVWMIRKLLLKNKDILLAGGVCLAVMGVLWLTGGLAIWSLLFGALLLVAGLAVFIVTKNDRDASELAQDAPDETPMRELTNKEFRAVLVDAMSEPCMFINADGRVETANEIARKRFRIMREQPVLSSVVRRRELLDAVSEARARMETQSFAFVERGEFDRHYACAASPVRTNSGIGVLITMDDLTAVKRAERARADFLANASHELRTPLTSLAGFIETMRGPARDDRDAWDHFLEIMQGQAERMRRLINDLLSLSRIELSEHRQPESDADLAAVVSEVVDALSPVAQEKGVTVRVSGPAIGVDVLGVRDELAQVAQNLIDNAIKYSEDGDKIEVEILTGLTRDEAADRAGRKMDGASRSAIAGTVSVMSGEQRFAALRVRDYGPGIDRKYLPRLSERFYRVDPGRGLRRGTGLGLAIVKHIVTRHRGEFMVESLVGEGTAFAVLLPLYSGKTDGGEHEHLEDRLLGSNRATS